MTWFLEYAINIIIIGLEETKLKSNKLTSRMKARTRKEKEVWEACQYLRSKKKNLTYYAIGEQLVHSGYKRGSNSDIRRYLTTWKQYHSPNPSSPTLAKQTQSIPLAIQEHEPLQKQTAEFSNTSQSQEAFTQQLLDISLHYAKQFDRLLKSNEFLRTENKILRKKLEQREEKTD